MSHGSTQEQQLKAEEYDLGFPRRRARRASCSDWGSRWDGGLVLLTTPIFDTVGMSIYCTCRVVVLGCLSAARQRARKPHARAIVPELANTGKRGIESRIV